MIDRIVAKFLKGLLNKRFKIKLPFWYITGLFVSLIIFLLYLPIPLLQTCITLQQQKICAPIGSFLAVILSFPGYFLAGFFPTFIVNSYWLVSFILVVSLSGVFYGLLGAYIDRFKKVNSRERIKMVFITVFFVLLIIGFFLWLRSIQ